MKIGDRIFVCGYIDEIRKDTVIVRNDGGYFGTIPSEVTGELPSAQSEQETGAWIQYNTTPRYVFCKCSACGADILVPCRNEKAIFSFCPNCGAKMVKDGDAK